MKKIEKLFSKNHIKFREKMKKTKIENIFQFLAFFSLKNCQNCTQKSY